MNDQSPPDPTDFVAFDEPTSTEPQQDGTPVISTSFLATIRPDFWDGF